MSGESVLRMLAAAARGDADEVSRLLDADRELKDAKGEHDKTALHLAAEKDHSEVARVLAEAGARLDALTSWSMTPLEWAANMNSRRVAEVLLTHGQRLSLWSASGLGKLEFVRGCFDARGRWKGESTLVLGPNAEDRKQGAHERVMSDADSRRAISDAFYIACRNGHLEVARFLRDRGAEIDTRGFFAAPGLHWAGINGHRATVEWLLDQGADPNIEDAQFQGNAIGWAVEGRHEDIARLLVERGAEPDVFQVAQLGLVERLRAMLDREPELVKARNGWGTPLQEAAARGSVECARLLLERGADPSERTSQGQTALDVARSCNHAGVVELLRQSPRRG